MGLDLRLEISDKRSDNNEDVLGKKHTPAERVKLKVNLQEDKHFTMAGASAKKSQARADRGLSISC